MEVANGRGYPADPVLRIGKTGTLDRELIRVIEAERYLFVTNNRQDFLKLHGELSIHEGLIVIVPSVRRDEQIRLFALALDWLDQSADLVNQVMEIDATGGIAVRPLAAPGL